MPPASADVAGFAPERHNAAITPCLRAADELPRLRHYADASLRRFTMLLI